MVLLNIMQRSYTGEYTARGYNQVMVHILQLQWILSKVDILGTLSGLMLYIYW